MKIMISPAKKMNIDTDTLPARQLPHFWKEADCLRNYMKQLSYIEAKEIWRCNDRIAELNYERLKTMDLQRRLTPAILAYEGIQYQYMAPTVMDEQSLIYLEKHLRILSGFYGVLRPFDGVVPYRLEMQAKLLPGGLEGADGTNPMGSLYRYWGSRLYDFLVSEEEDLILNLASREYSKCISDYCKGDQRFLTCVFGEMIDGKVKEKGTLAKMARGEMVRFLAENQITEPEGVKAFCGQGYVFREELSDRERLVFLKEDKRTNDE